MFVPVPAREDRANMAAHGRRDEADMASVDQARPSRRVGHPEKRSNGSRYVDELVQTKVWPNRAMVCDAGFAGTTRWQHEEVAEEEELG